MYYMSINKNFVHQVGNQPRLYYDARSTNHQDLIFNLFDNVCVLYVYARSM